MNWFKISDDDRTTNSIRILIRRRTLTSDADEIRFLDTMLARVIALYSPEDRDRLIEFAPPRLQEAVARRVAERQAIIDAANRKAEK